MQLEKKLTLGTNYLLGAWMYLDINSNELSKQLAQQDQE